MAWPDIFGRIPLFVQFFSVSTNPLQYLVGLLEFVEILDFSLRGRFYNCTGILTDILEISSLSK